MTAHTGGRSLAYVPRPRLLLARRRGGSSGSPCHTPFFPRILEHLIGLYFLIRQRGLWLLSFGIGLQLVAYFRCRWPADVQLSRQFRRRFALTNTPDEQDRLLWPEVTSFKDGAAIHVVDAFAFLAAVDIQFASFCPAKPAGLFELGPAVRTFQPFRVEVFLYPVEARLAIH